MTRLHHRPWLRVPATALLATYIRLIGRSGRFELTADPATVELLRARRPFIGAFWHGRMMMIWPAWRRLIARTGLPEPLRPCVIGSDHRDALFVAEVMSRLGVETRHGSNKRGGLAIYRNALRALGEGRIAVLTPDGPRGPAGRVKPGIVHLAARAGVPIVPASVEMAPAVRLRSWDSFLVPLPFAHGTIAFGAPLEIRPGDDPDRRCRDVERAINRLIGGSNPDLSDPLAATPA